MEKWKKSVNKIKGIGALLGKRRPSQVREAMGGSRGLQPVTPLDADFGHRFKLFEVKRESKDGKNMLKGCLKDCLKDCKRGEKGMKRMENR